MFGPNTVVFSVTVGAGIETCPEVELNQTAALILNLAEDWPGYLKGDLEAFLL